MAGGRFASKLLRPYQTDELYHNDTNGPASVSINALSTDGKSENTLSIKLSDTQVTPETETTLSSQSFSYNPFGTVLFDDNDNYKGVVDFDDSFRLRYISPSDNEFTVNNGPNSITRFNPVPALDTIPTNLIDIPYIGDPCDTNNYVGSFLVNLCDYEPYGGTKDISCLYEITAKSNDLGIRISRTCCTQVWSDYSIVGVSSFGFPQGADICSCRQSEFCVQSAMNGGRCYAKDYWSTHKPAIGWAYDRCCNCNGFVRASLNCCMRRGPCCCYCDDPGVCGTNFFQSFSFNSSNVPFSDCQNPCCGVGRVERSNDRVFHAACELIASTGRCNSQFIHFNQGRIFCRDNTPLDFCYLTCDCGPTAQYRYDPSPCCSVPLQWMTYNHKDCLNYMMWYHLNTPEWNGIYAIDTNGIDSQDFNRVNCSETCKSNVDYPDSFPKQWEKISDIPDAWCEIGPELFFNYKPFAANKDTFVIHVGNYDVDSNCVCRYVSHNLVDWCFSSDLDFFVDPFRDNKTAVGEQNGISLITDSFSSVCDAGLIESNTNNVTFERTGVVISDNDRIYVKNCSDTDVAIHVWGYTE